MRLIYFLAIIVLLMALAIGLTLKGEKIDLDSWSKEKVNLQLAYVDMLPRTSPQVLEISYFEGQNDIYNLFVLSGKSKVQRSGEQRTQGEYSAKITFGSTWEEIVLVYFPESWNKYRYLKFDIYNAQEKSLELQFRIGDFFDSKAFYLNSQKFKKEVELKQGWNRLEFSIEEISRKIDINSSHKSIHLSFFPQAGEAIYIDNFRLVKL
ncbi:MAG: hypothetical protein Q8O10_00585 [candidate division Zixibacteria bacterium]|nr:hypothetical protein [candidate division Zixibacteria bacterium]